MRFMKIHIQTIAQLIPELDSMMLPACFEEVLQTQLLQTHKVQVEFGHDS